MWRFRFYSIVKIHYNCYDLFFNICNNDKFWGPWYIGYMCFNIVNCTSQILWYHVEHHLDAALGIFFPYILKDLKKLTALYMTLQILSLMILHCLQLWNNCLFKNSNLGFRDLLRKCTMIKNWIIYFVWQRHIRFAFPIDYWVHIQRKEYEVLAFYYGDC